MRICLRAEVSFKEMHSTLVAQWELQLYIKSCQTACEEMCGIYTAVTYITVILEVVRVNSFGT